MTYDQTSPGQDILDLRDIVEERDRIWEALREHSAEVADVAQYEANVHSLDDDRCSNECVCTLAEKIEALEFDGAWAMVPALVDEDDDDPRWEAAGLDADDAALMRAIWKMEREELGDDLDSASQNEPVMIADSYFVTYAEQLADDLGLINGDAGWPMSHIDWDAAADDLKTDYTEVEYGGTTYFIRLY